MKTSDLDYQLPPELIAQSPAPERSASRLLVMDRKTGTLEDKIFSDLPQYLRPGDCLVLNDTKVIPARFFARRPTGGRIEALYIETEPDGSWHVMLKNARTLKPGDKISIAAAENQKPVSAKIVSNNGDGHWTIRVDSDLSAHDLLDQVGIMPLPPYIKRTAPELESNLPPEAASGAAGIDVKRYQTVYAANKGAIAAPTAGLHFTPELIQKLKKQGVTFATCTLHVGIGTFKPVAVDDLADHPMHYESYCLDSENAEIINHSKSKGCRIIPVGTTSVRTLETISAKHGQIVAASGVTNLFITPGFNFRSTDALITNFHLPKSTLLALVAALASLDFTKKAYSHAIRERYRFFSYGDAMLIQ
ncbi:MAG: tRNA preQ1(34) S-adenosylmethionine ribosyltransferase-isomerase QueA [Planctomycetes bacterium GWF2_50_10]|nr:MAG: tRNA preQ1(34) S-adenosylmethionine ribosyltransferase-isomerase QueA [Planctomycetes bacterium GWF2_50_10]